MWKERVEGFLTRSKKLERIEVEDHGQRAITTALWCNSLVFSLKFGVWFVSSSHVMLAEVNHSVADFANQALLAYGLSSAKREPDALHPSKFAFVHLDGTLNQQQREKVLKQFSEDSNILVLLMSLKAGGVGINLTAASNVFVMVDVPAEEKRRSDLPLRKLIYIPYDMALDQEKLVKALK